MKKLLCVIAIIGLLASSPVAYATTGQSESKKTNKERNQPIQSTASTNPVTGSGTQGRISKWTGTSGTNTFTLGDSNITEDKSGKVGIGTTTPTSQLTVQGMIETTLGGLKFPDGTVQTTAGLTSLFHNDTLTGNGASGSPLGVAVPLTLSGSSSSAILTVTNNGKTNITDGIAVQANGGVGIGNVPGGIGVNAVGGDSSAPTLADNDGGPAVEAVGGFGFAGGTGVSAMGGDGNFTGGDGMVTFGGGQTSVFGGDGIFAAGGVGSVSTANGFAGRFVGDVLVDGALNVTGTKNFKIDHPLDPENKYLLHAAIESSEVLNVYSGNVVIDAKGAAVVTLPNWFEALNRDFRYLLTPIGGPGPGLYIAEEINRNQFKIAGGVPGMKISWQVTGVRSDAVMLKRPFKVEEDKPEREQGTYLSPQAFGQPEERGVEWARHPEVMQLMKQIRLKQMEELKHKAQRER